jgi:hypothetical protein
VSCVCSMDNFSSHKVTGIRAAIESVRCSFVCIYHHIRRLFTNAKFFGPNYKNVLRFTATRTYSDLIKQLQIMSETIN